MIVLPRDAMAFSERWCAKSAWHALWLMPLAVLYGSLLFFLVIGEMLIHFVTYQRKVEP